MGDLELYREPIYDERSYTPPVPAPRPPVMKQFKVVTGNGSTYNYVAERMEHQGKFFHFFEGNNCVGVCSDYGVVSISDQPYNQRYVN